MSGKRKEELEQYDGFESEYILNEDVYEVYSDAIGSFLIEFSSLEHEINCAIAEHVNDRSHELGYQVVELLTFFEKLSLLDRSVSRFLSYVNEGKLEQFKTLISRVKNINSFRNKIAHANWTSLDEKGSVRTKIVIDNKDGKVEFERVTLTSKDIYEARDEAEELAEHLPEFIGDYWLKDDAAEEAG